MGLESPTENIFGGDVTTTGQLTTDGSGDTLYNLNQLGTPTTGGGGGGTWTPPSGNDGTLNIILQSVDAAQFFENAVDVGIGTSIKLTYSPSLTFGNSRTYKSQIAGKRNLNYFIVAVKTTQSLINGFLSSDKIVVEEYKYDSVNGNYVLGNIRELETTSGTIDLQFTFEALKVITQDPDPIVSTPIDDTNVQYEIAFGTNLNAELSDSISLKYQIATDTNDIVDSDTILLSEGSTDGKVVKKSILDTGYVNFELNGILPKNITYSAVYWANRTTAERNLTDFSKWNRVTDAFKIPAKQLLSGVVVFVELEKLIPAERPKITIPKDKYDVEVKESDIEKEVFVQFNAENADYVKAYISVDKFIKVSANSGVVNLFFVKDFLKVYGAKKIILVAESEKYGTGDKVELLITFISVNDFPSITQIIFPNQIDIPSFSDYNINYEVTYNTFATTNVSVELLQKDKTKIVLFKNLAPNSFFKINLRDLSKSFPNWNGSDNITLTITPLNNSGAKELIGNAYEIVTKLIIPTIKLDEDIIRKSIYDAFISSIPFSEPQKESKYLTHLANFGNDEQILISSWEDDNWTLSDKKEDEFGNITVTKEVNSTILKLYNPLPTNVADNSTFWITKLMANPLIETIILNDQDAISCPPLKGPNFNIDIDYVKGKSTNYESLDDLILSASVSSSAELIQTYLSSSLFDTSNLNIQYTSGSNINVGSFVWENFVHFSSAKERIDNFVYKVQLIEGYETAISSSLYYSGSISEISNGSGSITGSLFAIKERDKNINKKRQIIQGFDGFESFLYQSSSFSWPYNGSDRKLSTSGDVQSWYETIIELADIQDTQNYNYVLNNIPSYISDYTENDSYLLFLSMIGHHFDNIYFYTKAIERSRGLGYKSKNGISDKLLHDTLKSLSWNALNLDTNEQLWKLVFGMDSDGNTKEVNPLKQRTYEVWRRIVNNLPYLLKHKGTRRGIYAMMACYGIPSSNLSIIEFGGPEVPDTDSNKSKFVFDNITTGIVFNEGAYIEMPWKNTDKGRRPDTIELFVKPAYASDWTLITNDGDWGVSLSGSVGSSYGKVIFDYGTGTLETSNLPIFNNNFFGVCLTRDIDSPNDTFTLSVRQSNKEKTIFQDSVTVSPASHNYDSGNIIRIGNNASYSGSLDEFRLWSEVLDTEIFYQHVSFPEMINGNNISSSTDDLYLRLDSEYPKNLGASSQVYLPNIDTNIYFSSSLTRNDYEDNANVAPLYSVNQSAILFVTASGFDSIADYPYNFEVIDRSVVLEMPNIGSSRYSTNKVRFESQKNLNGNDASGGVDLSVKSRATKKAFDQAPVDSNRVGLFFSPTKELNIDIAKSFGGLNLDNYIGDPSDRYKSNYKSLDNLRKYYFKRFDNRDIYQYINLIKLYEKSMFEDIKKLLPARVKATTGLLIEPHFLERSRIQQNKPDGTNDYKEADLDTTENRLVIGEVSDLNAKINTEDEYNLNGTNNQHETVITDTTIDEVNADYYQQDSIINLDDTNLLYGENMYHETNIDVDVNRATIQMESENQSFSTAGQDSSTDLGFGIYSMHGHSIRSYYDSNGILQTERVIVYYLTEEKVRTYTTFKEFIDGVGDPRAGYNITTIPYSETTLNIKPLAEIATGDLITITAIDLEDDEITFQDVDLSYWTADLLILNRETDELEFRYPQSTGTIYTADLLGIDNENGAVAEGYNLDFITSPASNVTYGGFPTIGGRITNVVPVDGYTKYHYKRVGDLTRGLQNSYYNGSKNTAATTLDGSPPVEIFVTNPNTLRVNKAGRDANEPILEVE